MPCASEQKASPPSAYIYPARRGWWGNPWGSIPPFGTTRILKGNLASRQVLFFRKIGPSGSNLARGCDLPPVFNPFGRGNFAGRNRTDGKPRANNGRMEGAKGAPEAGEEGSSMQPWFNTVQYSTMNFFPPDRYRSSEHGALIPVRTGAEFSPDFIRRKAIAR